MVDSETSLAQAILYLRPQTAAAIEVLDIHHNEPYVFAVAPPPEPVDIPLGEIPDLFSTQLSPYGNIPHDYGRVSRESTPGLYSVSPKVLRIGFNSVDPPSPRGFEIGSRLASDVKVPYYSINPSKNPLKAYFQIHYNFNSGALLIRALDDMKVGSARLKDQESLLLIPGMSIHCGGEFEFKVEFPDLSNCAEEHERNYQEYATKLGISSAEYLPTSREEYPPIGAEHRSVAILGKGSFGEVHKALKNKTAESVAIKILSGGGKTEMHEVNIMSRLCHENIIKYERAFRLPAGQTCIVMELAVNDLETHLEARQTHFSLQCIRSIGRQGLSGLDYLHGMGVMHRDLKPRNILVTNWDIRTDTPAIKLADFGLAGVNPEHNTWCGSKGYIAPEVIKAHQKELENRQAGMKTTASNKLLMYTNAIDIWAFGKVLQKLVYKVPSHVVLRGAKKVPVNKTPALRLICQMMQEDPVERPTAANCLKEPWLFIIDRSGPPEKRERSPTLSISGPTSSTRPPLRKVLRKACQDSTAIKQGSTSMIVNAIWPDESSEPHINSSQGPCASIHSDEMNDRSLVEEEQIHHQATQLTLQREDRRLSLTPCNYIMMADTFAQNIHPTALADAAGPHGASSLKLFAALQSYIDKGEPLDNRNIAASPVRKSTTIATDTWSPSAYDTFNANYFDDVDRGVTYPNQSDGIVGLSFLEGDGARSR